MEVEVKLTTKVKISKEEFESYEATRLSGVTNMFHISNVCELTGLSRKKVLAITKNYSKLKKEYQPE